MVNSVRIHNCTKENMTKRNWEQKANRGEQDLSKPNRCLLIHNHLCQSQNRKFPHPETNCVQQLYIQYAQKTLSDEKSHKTDDDGRAQLKCKNGRTLEEDYGPVLKPGDKHLLNNSCKEVERCGETLTQSEGQTGFQNRSRKKFPDTFAAFSASAPKCQHWFDLLSVLDAFLINWALYVSCSTALAPCDKRLNEP